MLIHAKGNNETNFDIILSLSMFFGLNYTNKIGTSTTIRLV